MLHWHEQNISPLSDKACRQILAELRIRYLWTSYLSLQSSSTPVIKNRAPDIVLDRYSFGVKSSCSETLKDKRESVCNYVWSSLWSSRVYVDSNTKIPQKRLLKQQKCIFSQFWRVEGREQGVGRFGFPEASSWLADVHLLVDLHVYLFIFFLCPYASPVSLCVQILLMTPVIRLH